MPHTACQLQLQTVEAVLPQFLVFNPESISLQNRKGNFIHNSPRSNQWRTGRHSFSNTWHFLVDYSSPYLATIATSDAKTAFDTINCPPSIMGIIATVKMTIFHKTNCLFMVIPTQPTLIWLKSIDSIISKFSWKNKIPRIKLATLDLKHQMFTITLWQINFYK